MVVDMVVMMDYDVRLLQSLELWKVLYIDNIHHDLLRTLFLFT